MAATRSDSLIDMLSVWFDADGVFYDDPYYLTILHFIQKFQTKLQPYFDKAKTLTAEDNVLLKQLFDEMLQDPETVSWLTKDYTEKNYWDDVAKFYQLESSSKSEQMKALKEKTGVFIKSIYTLGDAGEYFLKRFLYLAHKELFDLIVERIIHEKFLKFFINIFTSRQSRQLDNFNRNRNGTGSFFIDVGFIRDIFNDLLKGKSPVICQLIELTATDVYLKLPTGTTYQQAVLAHKDRDSKLDNEKIYYDHSKFTLTHLFASELMERERNGLHTVMIVDDVPKIHEMLHYKYTKYCFLMHQQICMEFWPFADNKLPATKFVVESDGKRSYENIAYVIGKASYFDVNYRESLIWIAETCHEVEKKKSKEIDTALQLGEKFIELELKIEKSFSDRYPFSVSSSVETIFRGGNNADNDNQAEVHANKKRRKV